MRLNGVVQIQAEILIDEKEAELLEYMCSYGVADDFVSTYSTKHTKDYIKQTFTKLRQACAKILEAKEEAMKALNQ